MTRVGEPYGEWKDDETFDAIVIGSGMGGLGVAALLAKHAGNKVLVLEREVPQVAGKIDYHELSTPLSTRHFAAYPRGEIYGLDHSPARFREKALKPKTRLKGLYLTEQDVCTAGIAGALFGGVLAASSILGKNLLGEIGRGG